MAGEPAPLAAVQAAVMASAAGKQGSTGDASKASHAVQQDLSVLADQAKGYTKGSILGGAAASTNRMASARRLDDDRMKADALRAQALEVERIQTQRAQASAAADAQEAALRLASISADRQNDRLVQGAQNAKQQQAADDEARQTALEVQRMEGDRVLSMANQTLDPDNAAIIVETLPMTGSVDEAMAVFDNAVEYGAIPNADRDSYAQYAQQFHSAIQGGAVDMQRLRQVRSGGWASQLGRTVAGLGR